MMKILTKLMMTVIVLSLCSPALASWNFWSSATSTEGSGIPKTETRAIANYEKIVLDGVVNVEVKTSSTASLEITGDDNILPLIQTEVKDGVLYISSQDKQSYSPKVNLVVRTTTPGLTSIQSQGTGEVLVDAKNLAMIEVEGTGKVVATGLNTKELTVKSHGTSDVELVGETQNLIADITGTGNLVAKNFKALNADVSVSGTGDALIDVSGKLTASASGLGDIVYSGNPTELKQDTSGLGKITHE